MKKRFYIILVLPIVIAVASVSASAASDPHEISDAVEDAVGYESFLEALPEECVSLLEEYEIDLSSSAPAPGLMQVIFLIVARFFSLLSSYVPLFSVGIVLILVLKLLSSVAPGEGRTVEALGYLSVVSSGVYSFAVIEELLASLTEVTEQTASFMTAALPVLSAARIWAGENAGAATVSASFPVVLTLMSSAVSALYYPLCWFCYAASLSGFVRGQLALRPVVSSVKKICVRGVEILSGLSVGVFCVQRAASASADSLAVKGARFALIRLLPLAGNALTDGLETVYSCGRSVSGRVGVVCVIAVAILFVTPCVLGVFLVFLYSMLASVAAVLKVPLLEDFYGDVKDTFAMMTSFAVCSLVVLSSGLLILSGG